MSNWPKGREPTCPHCGVNPIMTRKATMCTPCRHGEPGHPNTKYVRRAQLPGVQPVNTATIPTTATITTGLQPAIVLPDSIELARRLHPGMADHQSKAVGPDSVDVQGDAATVTKTTSFRVKTLEDLVRVCEIDLKEWTVERYTCNKWESAAVPRAVGSDNNWSRPTTEPIITELFQVKVWLKRNVALVAARTEIAALVEDAKRQIVVRPARTPRVTTTSGNMLEIAIPDLHLGKLAWAKETGGENYDAKIAEAVFEAALEALVSRTACYRFDKVLFVIGNDLLHSDTKQGTTMAGTQLDTDNRFHKNFRIARLMVSRAIDSLREIAPVHAVMVPGNHDTLSVWHLGDSLECLYHKASDITIDNAPSMRKYVQHGKTMLLLTHGNRGKLADYPLLMAAEQPDMWGSTTTREAHTGDKHQTRVQEFHGVKVRISPALCPPDAWHSEHHFVGAARSAEAFIFHSEEGLIGTANYTVPTTKGKP